MKKSLIAFALALTLPFSVLAAKGKGDTFKVSTADSVAKWEGKKIGGAHQGELKFKGGELMVDKGALVGGKVEIDMTSLKNTDLTDGEYNAKLVNHLKSDDFFSVEKHPTATLKITKVEKKGGKTMVTGDLTIKGMTHPVTFPAEVSVDKGQVKAKGEMTVDRTLYDIRFRSAKFFENLGDKVIKDNFTVMVDLTASK
ncbi:MAG TPA: YceI family protein [Bdellovibrionota bacterium]|jgi:polyisoprenoid-binding protein YceI